MITRTVEYKMHGEQYRTRLEARFPAEHRYFSLTQHTERKVRGKWVEESCGVADAAFVKRFAPDLLDVHALHLADGAGVPLHAVANGVYWAAGALDGLGQTYHGGNGLASKTQDECLTVFAKYMRLSGHECWRMLLRIRTEFPAPYDAAAVARVKAFIEEQRPRWAMEAGACVSRHAQEAGLVTNEQDQ